MSKKRLLVLALYLVLVFAANRTFDSWLAGAFVIGGFLCGAVFTFMREMERDTDAQRTRAGGDHA